MGQCTHRSDILMVRKCNGTHLGTSLVPNVRTDTKSQPILAKAHHETILISNIVIYEVMSNA